MRKRGVQYSISNAQPLKWSQVTLSLSWEPISTTFTAGFWAARINSPIFENGCCPPRNGKTTSCQINGCLYVGSWELQSRRHKVQPNWKCAPSCRQEAGVFKGRNHRLTPFFFEWIMLGAGEFKLNIWYMIGYLANGLLISPSVPIQGCFLECGGLPLAKVTSSQSYLVVDVHSPICLTAFYSILKWSWQPCLLYFESSFMIQSTLSGFIDQTVVVIQTTCKRGLIKCECINGTQDPASMKAVIRRTREKCRSMPRMFATWH